MRPTERDRANENFAGHRHSLAPGPSAMAYGANPYACLRGVLEEAMALDPRPELVIATGDLAEDGSATSYKLFRELMLELGVAVQVIPGNHDDRSQMLQTLVGDSIGMDEVVDVAGWRLVLLDSQRVGKANGLIGDESMMRLESAIERAHAPCLVALHHSPPRSSTPGCRTARGWRG